MLGVAAIGLIVVLAMHPSARPGAHAAHSQPGANASARSVDGGASTASGAPLGGALSPGGGAGGAGAATPSAPAVTRSQQQLLRYVARLPTVHDITPVTVADYTDLVCATLRSPRMSPTFFQSVVQIEEHGYALTYEQTIGLLDATATSGCPSALPVIQSRGATTG